jgi:hypothetical protein
MTAGALAAVFAVPFYGTLLCVAPAVTKPTVQFGVRIPPERTGRLSSATSGASTSRGPP